MRSPFSPFSGGKVKPNLSARYGRGASFLWLATSPDAPELISGIKPTIGGTLRYGPVGPFGSCARFEGATDKFTFGAIDRHRMHATKFSMFACYRFDQGGMTHTLIDLTGGSAGWSLESSSTSASGGVRINSSFVGASSDANSGVADSWNNCGFGWETGSTYNLLINETIVSGTLGYNTPPVTNTVRFGPNTGAGAGRGTSVAMVALWPRALPVQELLQLALDWRELFRPMRYDYDAQATSPPPPSTYIGARYQMIGGPQVFTGGRAA